MEQLNFIHTNLRKLAATDNSGNKTMNNTFISYLEGLTPMKQNIAREAVEIFLKGTLEDKEFIKSSDDIYRLCKDLSMLNIEHFDILLMNKAYRLLKRINISSGGLDNVTVDVRVIMKHCIMNDATVLACVHNHPSGNVKPSEEDKNITKVIQKACKLFNIHFIDHVIIGDNYYHSFCNNGEL